MPVKRRIAKARIGADICPTTLWRLSDGLFPEPEHVNRWEAHTATRVSDQKLWNLIREELLRVWIDERPCSRPGAWWRFDAPEPFRKRLGGIGTPWCMALGCELQLEDIEFGIPDRFLDAWPESYGTPGMQDICPPLDPDDPPRYESQAAFLQRNKLLTAVELRHLAKHPGLLKPEIVQPPEEEE